MSPRLWLGLILVGGLALRLWGIGFAPGTPVGRPDEEIFSVEALAMFTRPCNRLATGWPDGYFMVWHALLWLQRAWFRLRHGGEVDVNLGCLVAVNPLALYLPARVLSALLGTATAWIVGRTAAALAPNGARRRVVGGRNLRLQLSRRARRALRRQRRAAVLRDRGGPVLLCAQAGARGPRWLIPAAFAAGIAFSTKYSAAALVVPCAVSAWKRSRRSSPRAGGSGPGAAGRGGGRSARVAAPSGELGGVS